MISNRSARSGSSTISNDLDMMTLGQMLEAEPLQVPLCSFGDRGHAGDEQTELPHRGFAAFPDYWQVIGGFHIRPAAAFWA